MYDLSQLNRVHSEIGSIYHQAALKMGLSDSAMSILYSICDLGDRCLLSELVVATCLSKQTVNSALRKLEKEGILTLEGTRKKTVCLTERGRALSAETVEPLLRKEAEILASWTEEEREQHLRLIMRYAAQLREKVEELSL